MARGLSFAAFEISTGRSRDRSAHISNRSDEDHRIILGDDKSASLPEFRGLSIDGVDEPMRVRRSKLQLSRTVAVRA